MRPDQSFISQPIRALQTMLRVISEHDPSHESLIPDGIYGPTTVRAVSVFQKNHGIPVTGITDQATWEAIWAAYEPALVDQGQAQGLFITLAPGQVFRKGASSPHVRLAQSMLMTLREVYKSVAEPSLSGILDDATSDSLASFQSLSGLPMTGELDKQTWKHLTLHYSLASDLMESTSL